MTKNIQRQVIEQPERTKEIIRLSKEALDGADEVRKRTRLSVDAATQCGKLLLEEQAHVKKTLGTGTWKSYFEITFSKIIPETTAFNWMRLARTSDQLPSNVTSITATMEVAGVVTNPPVTVDNPNTLRRGMLALDLFPVKVHTPTAEAGDVTAAPPPPAPYDNSHLRPCVAAFTKWHAAFTDHYKDTITQEQKRNLLIDLAPIVSFVDSLRA